MMKVTKIAFFPFALASLLLSGFLIFTPLADAFGAAGASCSDGSTIECTGVRCSSTGTSCSCNDGTDSKKCPKLVSPSEE